MKDTNIYNERLKRVHHNYQAFSLENSVNQQNCYLKLIDNIKEKNIQTIKIATDNYKEAYNELIEKIPVLKEANIKYNA